MTLHRIRKKYTKPHRRAANRRHAASVAAAAEACVEQQEIVDWQEAHPTRGGQRKALRSRQGFVWVYHHALCAYVFCKIIGRQQKGWRVLSLAGVGYPVIWTANPGSIHWISYDEPPRPIDGPTIKRAFHRAKLLYRRQ